MQWDLVDDRSAASRTQFPIIIIGQSSGGTLAKEMFVRSSPSYTSHPEIKELHSCIKGYAFFGTLQQGQFDPKALRFLNAANYAASYVTSRTQAVVDYIKQISRINEEFDVLGGDQIPSLCIYETRPSQFGFVSWEHRDCLAEY